MPRELHVLANLVYAAVEAEVIDALAEGRATLELVYESDEPIVRLQPRNDAAASLEVGVDFDRQVTCFVGDQGLPYEVYGPNPTEIVEEVRALTHAVVAGLYTERVNNGKGRSKGVADWPVGGQHRQVRYNVLRTPKPGDREWRTLTYAPY